MRGTGRVSQLFAEGESLFAYPIRYVILAGETKEECSKQIKHKKSEDEGENKSEGVTTKRPIEVLFNVPKRFHRRANKRNLLRRRVKEAYRLQRNNLHFDLFEKPIRIALVYSTKEVLDYNVIYRSVGKIIAHLNELYTPQSDD